MTWVHDLLQSSEGFRLYQQESTILNVTEMICELMEQKGVSRAALADQLIKTKGRVSQLLSGDSNMTLRTLSDMLLALDHSLAVCAIPIPERNASSAGNIQTAHIDWSHQQDYWSQMLSPMTEYGAMAYAENCAVATLAG